MNSIIQSLLKLKVYPVVGRLIEKDRRRFTIADNECISAIDGYDAYIRMIDNTTKFEDIEITSCQSLTKATTNYALVVWGEYQGDFLAYIANTLRSNVDVRLLSYTNNCTTIEREEGFQGTFKFTFEFSTILNTCEDVVCGC